MIILFFRSYYSIWRCNRRSVGSQTGLLLFFGHHKSRPLFFLKQRWCILPFWGCLFQAEVSWSWTGFIAICPTTGRYCRKRYRSVYETGDSVLERAILQSLKLLFARLILFSSTESSLHTVLARSGTSLPVSRSVTNVSVTPIWSFQCTAEGIV